MTEIRTIRCSFMDRLYGIRTGDIIITDDAYWMGEELIINSFYVGEEKYIKYSAIRIVEMKVENAPNIRITVPLKGKIVGSINIDMFRNITLFNIEI